VDEEGRCVGVLSSSDFVTWAGKDGKGNSIHFIAPWGETIDIDESPNDEVRCYMSARPITVAPSASLGELAHKMVAAHVHRVLVVVTDDRPEGIVTSTDILSAIAHASEDRH
jgi:CBS domain-containing protein